VNVRNNGVPTAGGVTLTDQLPAGVTFNSATPSQGTCAQSGGTVTCQLGTLAGGDSANVQVQVTPQQAGTITNVASVTSNEEDANSADDIARADTTVVARYARPKGATPIRVSLVPSFRSCTSPNRTHGGPLDFDSCGPPAQQSTGLTVGTPDANGNVANSIGSVRLDVVAGDVQETVSVTDVRKSVDLSDYTGQLQENATVRITDRANGPGDDQGTVEDLPFGAAVPCSQTADPSTGGTCALSTTFDALSPGVVVAGKRAIWQFGQVQLLDASDAPFAVQGVFVP
jgi:hypothetical protein